jgi:hypothetical protein
MPIHDAALLDVTPLWVRALSVLPMRAVSRRDGVVVAGAACAVPSRIAMLDAGVLVAMPATKSRHRDSGG